MFARVNELSFEEKRKAALADAILREFGGASDINYLLHEALQLSPPIWARFVMLLAMKPSAIRHLAELFPPPI